MDLIATTKALSAACSRLSKHPFVTVDTEFMRETTYYPKLCLIQMATPEEGVLVDPLAPGLDLKPFVELMANEQVIKVFHSARQDLEIVWNMGGIVPHPLFDTQVAAMVCGYGDSVSYEQLVNDLAKARIDKSSRFTDWSRRPLTEAQLTYALSDVVHLIPVYEELEKQLQENGRHGWLDEEMAVLTSPETYRAEPENAWRRLSGRMRKACEIAVLMEVAAWREREAQARDVPRGRVLKDETVIDLAVSAPRSVEALGRLRSIPTGFERSRQAQDILAAVERGLARDPKTVPVPERPARRQNIGAIIELLKVLLKAVAEQEGVAPKIIATVDELEAIAESDNADVSPLHGWRRQLFGEKALALKHGELGLSVNKGRVVVTPTQVEESATG
jgi:ribonuclease D